MNKKKLTIAGVIAAIVIILGVVFAVQANNKGKANQENNKYELAMNAGKDAVDSKNYRSAQRNFERASEIKPGDVDAKAYSKQAESFVEVNKDVKDFEFKDALDGLEDVISEPNGYDVMNKQAKKLSATLTEVQDNLDHEIKPLQDKAKAAADDKDFKGAVSAYDEILDLDYIKDSYYEQVYQDTKAARTEAQNLLKAEEESKKKEEEASSSSSSSSSSEENLNQEGATSEDKQVDGKEITHDMIAAARDQMKALGVAPGPWSDLDISRLIQISVGNGHDQITKDDIDQFLK